MTITTVYTNDLTHPGNAEGSGGAVVIPFPINHFGGLGWAAA